MRYCNECLDNLVINMRMAGKSRPFTDFLPKKEYILDNTICDMCGQKLSEKMLKQWIQADKLYGDLN